MNDDLHYDTAGMDLTEDAEGLRLTAYPDPGTGGDPFTCGFGHTGPDVCAGLTIDQAQATAWLAQDIQAAEADVKRLVTVPLTQGQYDALVDFTFNKGPGNLERSTLLRLVNAGQMEAADKEFGKWVYGGGHILPGLVKRAYAEATIFNA